MSENATLSQIAKTEGKIVANPEHVDILKHSPNAWNAWRRENSDIREPKFIRADLMGADLTGANLVRADLTDVDLMGANLHQANLTGANLANANLTGANLQESGLANAKLMGANLAGANLIQAVLTEANLTMAILMEANLTSANLWGANLTRTNLTGADLTGAVLMHANLIETNFTNATLHGCRVYGCSAWNLTLEGAKQRDLVISKEDEPLITVDGLEVAQFIYLLLKNEKIRDVINTIGKKAVLILGRFAIAKRKNVLDAMRDALRKHDYLPIVFDFECPTDRDFTETILTLAGMSKFIIADITNPKSSPLELQVIVPNYMIPLVTIIQADEKPFSMFEDLWHKYPDHVLDPIKYSSVNNLIGAFENGIIKRATDTHTKLRIKKDKKMQTLNADDFQ
jgi:uncharacterized protein YjbI with pentapeptide repeats